MSNLAATAPATPATADRRVPATALAAMLNAVGGGLGWSVIPPLLAQIGGDLQLTPTLAGVVWGAAPLGIALAAPLGGALADRHGAHRVAGLAMLWGGAACAARALTVGPWSLALAMLAFGLHIGFVATSIPKALAMHVPVTRLARANGLALLAYTLTTALSILFARNVAAWLGGWRPLMVATGGAMALAGVAWLILYRDRAMVSRGHAALRDMLRAARNPGLQKLAMMHFLLFGGYLALLGLLPRTLLAAGIAPAHVGLTIAGWLVCAAAANALGPWLADRFVARRIILVGGALVAGTALLALALLPIAAAPILLPIAALGGGMVAPLILALPGQSLPGIGPARAGTALGLLMLVGQMGGFLLPIVAGAAGGNALLVLACAHLRSSKASRRLALGGTARPAGLLTAQPGCGIVREPMMKVFMTAWLWRLPRSAGSRSARASRPTSAPAAWAATVPRGSRNLGRAPAHRSGTGRRRWGRRARGCIDDRPRQPVERSRRFDHGDLRQPRWHDRPERGHPGRPNQHETTCASRRQRGRRHRRDDDATRRHPRLGSSPARSPAGDHRRRR